MIALAVVMIVLAAAALVGVVGIIAGWWPSADVGTPTWVEGLTRTTIEVHTKLPDDQTIKGLLAAEHSDSLTLIEAVYRHKSGDQPIEGAVHVPRENVSWIREVDA